MSRTKEQKRKRSWKGIFFFFIIIFFLGGGEGGRERERDGTGMELREKE